MSEKGHSRTRDGCGMLRGSGSADTLGPWRNQASPSAEAMRSRFVPCESLTGAAWDARIRRDSASAGCPFGPLTGRFLGRVLRSTGR